MISSLKKTPLILLVVLLSLSTFQPVSTAAQSFESSTTIPTETGTSIGIGEPKLSSSNNFFSFFSLNDNKNVTYSEDVTEDSITQTIYLEPSMAGKTIEIPFVLNNGEKINLAKDENNNSNGASNILDESENSIGIITTESASDDVTISAEVRNDNVLELYIDSDEIAEPTQLIVTMSATYYSTYFSSFSWITRSGVMSLSLTHKPYLTGAKNEYDALVRLSDAWQKVLAVHSSSTNWYNTTGMKDQFTCHFNHAASKNPWNLEPSRPNVGYTKTVLAGCNP